MNYIIKTYTDILILIVFQTILLLPCYGIVGYNFIPSFWHSDGCFAREFSVKDTALLSAIAVNEITHQAQAYAALSFKAIPTYTALAAFYLVILSVLIIVQKQIERKMR